MSLKKVASELSTRTKLITHGNCSDGMASAMLFAFAFPDIEIEFHHYGSEAHESLAAEPGLVFCDFSPPEKRAQEFVDAGAVVIDHHHHAKNIVEMFGDRGLYSDMPGESGAVLARMAIEDLAIKIPLSSETGKRLREIETVWPLASRMARMIGIRDTWQKDSSDWGAAQVFTQALGNDPTDLVLQARNGKPYPTDGQIDRAALQLADRVILVDKQEVFRHVLMLPSSSRRDQLIIPVSVFNDGQRLVSDVAERERQQGATVIVGFFYVTDDPAGPKIVFSIRSSDDFDAGAFCKQAGADYHGSGGGHKRAAGCSFLSTTVDGCPFAWILNRLREHLKRARLASLTIFPG